MVPLSLLIPLILTFTHTAVAHAERWRSPLAAVAVARGYDIDGRMPFAPGARRGVRLTGVPGETVRAPCSGRVTFAGPVPRLGSGVSLRCGRLAATEFGLERVRTGRGAVVVAGAPVGALGVRGTLYLGARVAADRWGYRDPLRLLDGEAERPLGPAPLPLRAPARRPRAPIPAVPPVVAPQGPPLLLAAWIGAATAGIGAGLGVTLHRRSRRGRSRAPARAGRHVKTH